MRNSITVILMLAALMMAASMTGTGDLPRLSGRSVFRNLSRGDVFFPHDRHYDWGIGCLSCHHRYSSGTNVLTMEELRPGTKAVSCASCHGSGRELERVYHRQCIDCHRDFNKKNIVSGPVMCGRCHIKREN